MNVPYVREGGQWEPCPFLGRSVWPFARTLPQSCNNPNNTWLVRVEWGTAEPCNARLNPQGMVRPFPTQGRQFSCLHY